MWSKGRQDGDQNKTGSSAVHEHWWHISKWDIVLDNKANEQKAHSDFSWQEAQNREASCVRL